LNGLILGEALLNDAVAVVLCTALEEYEKISVTQGEDFEAQALFVTVIK
jgi:NhaP-type Na+/H+ or K+/H+ antiporter